MPDDERFQVLGPLGVPEGPFSRADLRQRLATGRLRREDRVIDLATQQPRPLEDLVPDAEALEAEARRRTSDRIRRKTSERHAALAVSQAPSATTATTSAAPPPEPSPWVAVERPRRGSRRVAVSAGIGAVVIALGLGAWFLDPTPSAGRAVDPTVVQGVWTTDAARVDLHLASLTEAEAKAVYAATVADFRRRAGDLQVDVGADTVRIRSGTSTSDHRITRTITSPLSVLLDLQPAHPVLGSQLPLRVQGGNVDLVLIDAEAPIALRRDHP